jgi:hypothetical protein
LSVRGGGGGAGGGAARASCEAGAKAECSLRSPSPFPADAAAPSPLPSPLRLSPAASQLSAVDPQSPRAAVGAGGGGPPGAASPARSRTLSESPGRAEDEDLSCELLAALAAAHAAAAPAHAAPAGGRAGAPSAERAGWEARPPPAEAGRGRTLESRADLGLGALSDAELRARLAVARAALAPRARVGGAGGL